MLIANYDFEIDKKVSAEEAFDEGKLEGKKENALNMLKDGLPIEKVAKYSGLSIEQIKALQWSK